MIQCPYRRDTCGRYLAELRQLSEPLASRVDDTYCHGRYKACRRFEAAEQGKLGDHEDLAPWSGQSGGMAG